MKQIITNRDPKDKILDVFLGKKQRGFPGPYLPLKHSLLYFGNKIR